MNPAGAAGPVVPKPPAGAVTPTGVRPVQPAVSGAPSALPIPNPAGAVAPVIQGPAAAADLARIEMGRGSDGGAVVVVQGNAMAPRSRFVRVLDRVGIDALSRFRAANSIGFSSPAQLFTYGEFLARGSEYRKADPDGALREFELARQKAAADIRKLQEIASEFEKWTPAERARVSEAHVEIRARELIIAKSFAGSARAHAAKSSFGKAARFMQQAAGSYVAIHEYAAAADAYASEVEYRARGRKISTESIQALEGIYGKMEELEAEARAKGVSDEVLYKMMCSRYLAATSLYCYRDRIQNRWYELDDGEAVIESRRNWLKNGVTIAKLALEIYRLAVKTNHSYANARGHAAVFAFESAAHDLRLEEMLSLSTVGIMLDRADALFSAAELSQELVQRGELIDEKRIYRNYSEAARDFAMMAAFVVSEHGVRAAKDINLKAALAHARAAEMDVASSGKKTDLLRSAYGWYHNAGDVGAAAQYALLAAAQFETSGDRDHARSSYRDAALYLMEQSEAHAANPGMPIFFLGRAKLAALDVIRILEGNNFPAGSRERIYNDGKLSDTRDLLAEIERRIGADEH